jgi:hypothetical protein
LADHLLAFDFLRAAHLVPSVVVVVGHAARFSDSLRGVRSPHSISIRQKPHIGAGFCM